VNDNVVKFYPRNAAQNPNAVIEQAHDVYQDILIIGYDKEGFLDVRGSLGLSKAEILFLVKKFEHKLMNGDYDD